jgi:hypothetical protein
MSTISPLILYILREISGLVILDTEVLVSQRTVRLLHDQKLLTKRIYVAELPHVASEQCRLL